MTEPRPYDAIPKVKLLDATWLGETERADLRRSCEATIAQIVAQA